MLAHGSLIHKIIHLRRIEGRKSYGHVASPCNTGTSLRRSFETMSANYTGSLSNTSIYYVLLPDDSLPLQIKVEKNDLFPLNESHCSLLNMFP